MKHNAQCCNNTSQSQERHYKILYGRTPILADPAQPHFTPRLDNNTHTPPTHGHTPSYHATPTHHGAATHGQTLTHHATPTHHVTPRNTNTNVSRASSMQLPPSLGRSIRQAILEWLSCRRRGHS